MNQISGQKTISEVAKQVMVLQENWNQSDLERLVQIGIQGYTDMNIYDLPIISKSKKKIGDSLSINLPADFVREIKVQGLFGNSLVQLKEKAMNTFMEEDCGDERPPLREEAEVWLSKVRMQEVIGGDYTASGEFDYWYNIDYAKRQMFFNMKPPTGDIYLEYIGSGIPDSGETYIHLMAVTPLRDYIAWQKDMLNPRVPANNIAMREDRYFRSLAKMRHGLSLMTHQQYLDELWGHISQMPKR